MTTFCTLFSGSSGNAAVLHTGRGAILIDCGMSGKQTLCAMASAGLNPGELRGILITHEHSDHVRGVGVISRKLDLPIYATEGTWQGMEAGVGCVPLEHRVTIAAGESFFLNDVEVAPFAIPHDANEPVGYRIYLSKHSVAIATDLGYFSPTVRDAVTGAELILLESNHDPDLLRQNLHYPAVLKNRILGRKGHLSNDSGAAAAAELARSGTRHLLLGHLSRENNTPEMAYRTAYNALTGAGAEVGGDVTLHVATRDYVSHLYTIA